MDTLVCLVSSGGASGTFSRASAGIGVGMAIERAAKRETALIGMDVVFSFAVSLGGGFFCFFLEGSRKWRFKVYSE